MVRYCSAQNRELRNAGRGLSGTGRLIPYARGVLPVARNMKKETNMTPQAFRRPLNVALVLALCAVILSARLLLGYTHVENPPPPPAAEAPLHPDELPPVW